MKGIIHNTRVYGLPDAVKASKYPMLSDIKHVSPKVTDTVVKLGHSTAGSGHDQFLTGIVVQFDLTFTIKAWTEAQRYHFLDFVSSQSTMHRITSFDIGEQCCEYVDERVISIVEELVDKYNSTKDAEDYLRLLYNVPCGFRLTAAMTTNYRQLKTIYRQRKNHRLPEWREFCRWIERLPQFDALIGCD